MLTWSWVHLDLQIGSADIFFFFFALGQCNFSVVIQHWESNTDSMHGLSMQKQHQLSMSNFQPIYWSTSSQQSHDHWCHMQSISSKASKRYFNISWRLLKTRKPVIFSCHMFPCLCLERLRFLLQLDSLTHSGQSKALSIYKYWLC